MISEESTVCSPALDDKFLRIARINHHTESLAGAQQSLNSGKPERKPSVDMACSSVILAPTENSTFDLDP